MSTIENFECDDKTDESAELWADIIEVLENRMSFFELIQKKPKRIHMISNIHRAYGVLYFEKYGRQYYDIGYSRPQIKRHETAQIPQPQQFKIEKSTGEMIPITDPDELVKMPF